MADDAIAWPKKTREFSNELMDSRIWDRLVHRHGDVVVSTYSKSGTTWVQQIVGQLMSGADPDLRINDVSPWLEARILPPDIIDRLEARPGPRIFKTHLPVEALPLSRKAKYIYVGRDGRDVVWSLYNHHLNIDPSRGLRLKRPTLKGPMFDPPAVDVRTYFLEWLEHDGQPFWSFWENVASWWAVRDLPNVLLVHFADLKRDLEGEMRRIAGFLQSDLPAERWPAAVEHCTFDWMKAHAETVAPLGGSLFKGGAQTFIHKGQNGRWRDVLTAQDIAAYESRAVAELGPECARWLAEGEG